MIFFFNMKWWYIIYVFINLMGVKFQCKQSRTWLLFCQTCWLSDLWPWRRSSWWLDKESACVWSKGHCNWILEGKNLHFFKQRLTGKPLLSEPTWVWLLLTLQREPWVWDWKTIRVGRKGSLSIEAKSVSFWPVVRAIS